MFRSGARKVISAVSTRRSALLKSRRFATEGKNGQPTNKVTYDSTTQPQVKQQKRSNTSGYMFIGLGLALIAPAAYALYQKQQEKAAESNVEKQIETAVKSTLSSPTPAVVLAVEETTPVQPAANDEEAVSTSAAAAAAAEEAAVVIAKQPEPVVEVVEVVLVPVSEATVETQLAEITQQAEKLAALEASFQQRLLQADESRAAALAQLKSEYESEVAKLNELIEGYKVTVQDYASEVASKNQEISQLNEKYQITLNEKQSLEENWNRLLEQIKTEHEAETQEALTQLRQQLTLRYVEMLSETVNDFSRVLERVFDIEKAYKTTSKLLSVSTEMHSLALAVMSLIRILQYNAPFKPEMDTIIAVGSNDPLVEAVALSLPENIARSGVPTIIELQQRFVTVSKAARTASYIPADAGLVGFLYSKLVSLVVVPEHGLVDGDSVNARLARAEFYLSKGKLDDAVAELDQLIGSPAAVAADWLLSAKQRLVAEQAVKVLEAHISALTASAAPLS